MNAVIIAMFVAAGVGHLWLYLLRRSEKRRIDGLVQQFMEEIDGGPFFE